MTITRRSVASMLGLAAVPVGAVAAIPVKQAPLTDEEMNLYHTFLWCELCSIAEERGVETFDPYLKHLAGGREHYRAMTKDQPPSTRARAMLCAATGLEAQMLPTVIPPAKGALAAYLANYQCG